MVARKLILLSMIVVLLFIAGCSLSDSGDDPNIVNIPCNTHDLIVAINSANATASTTDEINLDAGCIYEIDTIHISSTMGDFGMPEITSNIEIHGNGATIRIVPSDTAQNISGFYVAPNGSLSFDNLTFTRGPSSTLSARGGNQGGAILNSGSLTISHVDFVETSARQGGAIFSDGTLLVQNSSFMNNQGNDGGAIYVTGTAEITNSVFQNNTAYINGGALMMDSDSGVLTVIDCVFEGNEVIGGAGGFSNGGAINILRGSAEIQDSLFNNNSAYDSGGALYSWNADLIITDSEFTNNTAQKAGAIAHSGGALEVYTSTLSGNRALQLGGAIMITNQADALLDSSSITGNQSPLGGAIYAYSNTAMALINTTISENSITGQGNGYVIVALGDMLISYSTIANNTGSTSGIFVDAGVTVAIANSIVANNMPDCTIQGTLNAVNQNMDSDGTCTGFTLTGDPLLGPLANNYGPTMTHALLPGSPALDAALGSCPATDQRLLGRPGGSVCDLGAYEDVALEPILFSDMDGLPRVEIGRDTLCWGGPGDQYPVVQTLASGAQVPLAGVGMSPGWFVVYSPIYEGATCWVPEDDATPIDPLGDLNVFRDPPFPTPTPTDTPEPGEEEQGCWVGGPQTAPICIFPCPDWDANPNACTPP